MKKRDIDSGRIDSMGRRIKMSGKSHAHQEDKKTFHHDFSLTHFYTGNDTKLKNMDCDELSVELVEISNDPYIDWGSSSQGDFTFSIEKAYQWHHGQERANRGNHPKTPYIEHPLRNTLRLHRWGVFDGEVLTAAVLHDVVEDCADKITGIKDQNHNESDLRDKAVTECKNIFGDNVTKIIKDVSNPIASYSSREEKNQAYREHLDHVLDDPQVFLVKLSDYYDNAGGLHHNLLPGKEDRIRRMHDKYAPLIDVFQTRYECVKDDLPMEDSSVVHHAIMKIRDNLEQLDQDLSKMGK